MCYHTSNTKNISDFEEYFQLELKNSKEINEKYVSFFHAYGFEYPYLPVIINEDGEHKIDLFRFGLIPSWIKKGKYKANTLNARNDKLFENDTYRNYWHNRCLVIVTGFFEPHDPRLSGRPYPASDIQATESWYIHHKSEPFLTLGGIYNGKTVSILTTDASVKMAEVHNDGKRQPLIIDTTELREEWLQPKLSQERMAEIMKYTPDDSIIEAYRTIDGIMVNKVNTNKAAAILPYEKKTNMGFQTSLFG